MKKLWLIGLVGCAHHAAHVDAPAGGAPAGVRELTLYRDGALVRDRRDVDTKVGTTILSMPIPDDVDAGGLVARVITPDAGVDVGTIRVIQPTLQAGDHVQVIEGQKTIEGTLAMLQDGILVLDTGEVILDARHVVKLGGGGATRHVDLEVDATAASHATVELAYLTQRLSWSADYTLVMDEEAHQAELHGALGIDNGTGVAYDDAIVTLVDTNRPVKLTAFDETVDDDSDDAKPGQPPPVADPTKPRGEQPIKLKKPAETPRTSLPFTVDVAIGTQSVSLMAGAEVLPASQTMVYDPVGDDKNQSGREPYSDRNYGLDRTSTAVSQSIDVTVAKVPTGMPAGKVRLLTRTATGALSPLGEARIFERAGTDTDKVSPTTSVAIGRAGEIEGKRERLEYTFDTDAKRLVEEFEITLTSTADHPIDVIVREHMYRGLNWSLPYWNVASVVKEGPQKIALATTVPAKGTTRVVYTVVYHW